MLTQWLHDETLQIQDSLEDWRLALDICARPLLDSGVITPEYVSAIISQQQRLGPYYVIAPGLAMPHARPEDGAKGLGLSLLKLRRGVIFNTEEFDPVDLIIMLAAPDKHSHLEMIAALSELFSSDDDLHNLHHADSVEEIKNIIMKF